MYITMPIQDNRARKRGNLAYDGDFIYIIMLDRDGELMRGSCKYELSRFNMSENSRLFHFAVRIVNMAGLLLTDEALETFDKIVEPWMKEEDSEEYDNEDE